jgi:hypothetical protein
MLPIQVSSSDNLGRSTAMHRRTRMAIWFAACVLLLLLAELLTGISLGWILTGLVMAVVLVPFAVVRESRETWRLLAASAITDGIGLCWGLVAIFSTQMTIMQGVGSYAVLLGVALLMAGIVEPLRWLGRSAAGLAVLLGALWLAFPVWGLHHLSPASMQTVINLHPLFALNAVWPRPIWTEGQFAYQLVNLNQDVPYALPSSPITCIMVHALLGGLLIWIAGNRRAS